MREIPYSDDINNQYTFIFNHLDILLNTIFLIIKLDINWILVYYSKMKRN